MCDFVSRVGERHQRSPKQALLGPCEPVVNESRTAANLDERKPVPPRRRENKRAKERQKRKSRPRRACKGRSHNPNMKQRREGVKKEQVKGCGSVNRPTPGSQRPAEPVASGFSQGVKISKNRGQFSGLGVKLWVVDDGLSQCRAIPYGVRIGVTTISCYQQGKQSARLSAWHEARG